MTKGFLAATIMMLSVYPAFAQVDYYERIQPIFNEYCTSCHAVDGHGDDSGVFLESYEKVMDSEGEQYGELIVEPEKPDESPLVDKIENDDPEYGNRMPPRGSMSDEEIEAIRQWIEEGAKEETATRASRESIADGFELIGNYPNPFNPATEVRFKLPEPAEYTVRITDMTGRRIYETRGSAREGETGVRVDLSARSSGLYLYEVVIHAGNNPVRLSGEMTLIK